jgi:hypothetical protein
MSKTKQSKGNALGTHVSWADDVTTAFFGHSFFLSFSFKSECPLHVFVLEFLSLAYSRKDSLFLFLTIVIP